ncbi:MAG: cyclic lactone autoinducer peptide [Tissierella sp.]|nr:cyclic lactone autoinducer peptide [Tissierella sp.]
MKRIILLVSGLVASISLSITSLNVNSSCAFLIHQPKLPQGAEKLSKY